MKTPNLPPADFPPADALDRVFHEPARLAVLSELVRHTEGVIFRDLKAACGLTDGNLNRHLKVLEEARAVVIRKRFVKRKPQTRVLVTEGGAEAFARYLRNLQDVIAAARLSLGKGADAPTGAPATRRARRPADG